MVEDSVLGSRYRTTVQEYLNRAYRHRIISAERPPAACERCMPRDYTDHEGRHILKKLRKHETVAVKGVMDKSFSIISFLPLQKFVLFKLDIFQVTF